MKNFAATLALALSAIAAPALANDGKSDDKAADTTTREIGKASPSDDRATAPKETESGKETGK